MNCILFDENGKVREKTVNDLAEKNPAELVRVCEDYYNGQLAELSDKIVSEQKCKIVLIAGPSGSGKTTTAMKLSEHIEMAGKKAIYISLDDFFINRDELPKLENGKTDFESVNTLDIAEIRKCFGLLLAGKKTVIPYFDFVSGKRDMEKSRILESDSNGIIIVEGLHGLNPRLTDGIEAFDGKGFYKVFVNPLSQIYDENDNKVLKRRSIRLMRRMIRDYIFRGSSLSNTMNMWDGVCSEEIKSIIPFKDTADSVVDTTHFYEPCVYHNFLLPIITKSKFTDPKHIDTIAVLSQKLDIFYDISEDVIPENSMIREFVGKV